MNNPRLPHMAIAKHILRYLKCTIDLGLFFLKKTYHNEVKNRGVWRLGLIQIGVETK